MTANVTLQPSGKLLVVREDESILDAALRQGVALPYGCRSGSCGTCECRLVDGEVDYPDVPPLALTDEDIANGAVLTCRAHPSTDLVLDAQELAGAGDIVIKTLPTRVVRLEKLCHDVMGVWLKLPAVERLAFRAGQYIDILLKDGTRRSFSLANPPHDDELLELHIRHVPGGQFTTEVFDDMREKALLRLQGPLGTFYLRENSDRPVIMVGGGTGLAPLKAMVESAHYHGITRPIRLYWGVRAERDIYARELLEQWSSTLPDFRYTIVLSDPQEDDAWEGAEGFVHEVVVEDYPDLAAYDVYMAGPPPMVEAGKKAFLKAGLPYERLFFDSFDFAAEVQAKLDELAAADRGE
ncbi:MAG: CDP-6-deoxy-delta-3,4-glucoseen reductase [Gammaproteobacteria bacterium]|nr:CDP-6-deoxy-delta-3,4-glucoseen reductase [Gammaproteobacteria bacterium]